MILFETKYLSLISSKRKNNSDWVYAKRPNSKDIVVILPVIKQKDGDEVLFLITKRPPLIAENIAEFCVELPAGLVGDENPNESIEDAIKKELKEETGHVLEEYEILNKKVSSSAGLTCETSTIVIAKITDPNIKSLPIDDGGVIFDRVYVKKEDISEFLNESSKKGFAISAQALSALYYLSLKEKV